MATTLSNGYVKPQSGDLGSVFWLALEDNIQQLNDHTHDGVDSEKLTASSSDAVSQTLSSGSWSLVANGIYRQLGTVPSGMTVDLCNISFRHGTSGDYLYLAVTKASSTTYYVYINDSSIDVKAVYTT